MKTVLIVNQKINRLTLIEKKFFTKRDTVKPHNYWLCRCDCGNEVWVRANRVITQKSCGCIRGENKRLPKMGQGARNSYYHNYKTNAKTKGLNFELTVEQFEILTSGNCHYCGDKPSTVRFATRCWGGYIHNGIDRVDSSKGYVIDNCVSCCKTCNFAKNTMSYNEFIEWIKRLIKYRGNNG